MYLFFFFRDIGRSLFYLHHAWNYIGAHYSCHPLTHPHSYIHHLIRGYLDIFGVRGYLFPCSAMISYVLSDLLLFCV